MDIGQSGNVMKDFWVRRDTFELFHRRFSWHEFFINVKNYRHFHRARLELAFMRRKFGKIIFRHSVLYPLIYFL